MDINNLNITVGSLPAKVRGLVEEWAELHRDELLQCGKPGNSIASNPSYNKEKKHMECISMLEARYVNEYRIYLKFNTGEAGEVDLWELAYKHPIAEPLRNPEIFSRFHLDSWPTLVWDCGFDVAPESLYYRATGKTLSYVKNASFRLPCRACSV